MFTYDGLTFAPSETFIRRVRRKSVFTIFIFLLQFDLSNSGLKLLKFSFLLFYCVNIQIGLE